MAVTFAVPMFNTLKNISDSFFDRMKKNVENRVVERAREQYKAEEPKRLLTRVNREINSARKAGVSEIRIQQLRDAYENYISSQSRQNSYQVERLCREMYKESQLQQLLNKHCSVSDDVKSEGKSRNAGKRNCDYKSTDQINKSDARPRKRGNGNGIKIS